MSRDRPAIAVEHGPRRGPLRVLDGLIAVAIDEVKYKKGRRYLTVVCDHVTGRVIWAAKGRSKETVGKFFDALGTPPQHRLNAGQHLTAGARSDEHTGANPG